MECHSRRYQRLVDESGQGTVEYAVVLSVFLCVAAACAALWRLLDAGVFVDHALASASHHINASVGWIADVFSY